MDLGQSSLPHLCLPVLVFSFLHLSYLLLILSVTTVFLSLLKILTGTSQGMNEIPSVLFQKILSKRIKFSP